MKLKTQTIKSVFLLTGFVLISALVSYQLSQSLFQLGSTLSGNVLFGTFSDVPSSHPNYEAINYLQDEGVVTGYPDGFFRPDNPINRAEFTKIITEAYYPGQAVGDNCFPDVGTQWFAKYVCFDKKNNFIAGYPDGSFKPADNINFAEIAKILTNVSGLTVTPSLNFWYRSYVEKLEELQAIPMSIISFDQKVTRGEMSEMVYRLRADVRNKFSKTYDQLAVERDSIGLPVRLRIPGINVDAAVESVGLTPEGAVGIPLDPDNAAWYEIGTRPGDIGSAVITGHINWYDGATGVFEQLNRLQPGDKIMIQDDKGAIISFVVRESRSYDATANVPEVFFSYDGKVHLNLITCEGVWNSQAGQYTKRLVVFADME